MGEGAICIDDSDDEGCNVLQPTITASTVSVRDATVPLEVCIDSDDDIAWEPVKDKSTGPRDGDAPVGVTAQRREPEASHEHICIDSDEDSDVGLATPAEPVLWAPLYTHKVSSERPESEFNEAHCLSEPPESWSLEPALPLSGDVDELEVRADWMARKTLEKQNLPVGERAEKISKVKEGILRRLREVGESFGNGGGECQAPPPPAPSVHVQRGQEESNPDQAAQWQDVCARFDAEEEERRRQLELMKRRAIQLADTQLELAKNETQQLAHAFVHAATCSKSAPPRRYERPVSNEVPASVPTRLVQVALPGSRSESEVKALDRQASERHAKREQRKALWSVDSSAACAEQGQTANGWEHSQFDSAEVTAKFRRLMGGQKFESEAAAAAADDDLPTDCPVFELCGGEWVENTSPDRTRADLERLFEQGRRQLLMRGRGLGAS